MDNIIQYICPCLLGWFLNRIATASDIDEFEQLFCSGLFGENTSTGEFGLLWYPLLEESFSHRLQSLVLICLDSVLPYLAVLLLPQKLSLQNLCCMDTSLTGKCLWTWCLLLFLILIFHHFVSFLAFFLDFSGRILRINFFHKFFVFTVSLVFLFIYYFEYHRL